MGGCAGTRSIDEARGDALAELCVGWLASKSTDAQEASSRSKLLLSVMGSLTKAAPEGESPGLTYGDFIAWHLLEWEVERWGAVAALDGCSSMTSNFMASIRSRKGIHEFCALVGRSTPVSVAPTLTLQLPVAVTGAGGFIGSWIVKLLLEMGRTVHGTVRSIDNPSSWGHLLDLPGAGGSDNLPKALSKCSTVGFFESGRLKLFPADLRGGVEPFMRAFSGCSSLIHVASPYDVRAPKEDLVSPSSPAIAGTTCVLSAAESTRSIERVVLTSSAAAVYNTRAPLDHVYTEDDWSDESLQTEKKSWYALGKTLAEKAAWNFVGSERHKEARKSIDAPPLSLATICPTQTLGPLLEPRLNQSTLFLAEYCNGVKTVLPAAGKCLVDVRDVAMAHVLALAPAKVIRNSLGQERYTLIAGSLPWRVIASELRKCLPPETPIPTMLESETPSYPQALHSTLSTHALGLSYRPMEVSIADSAASLLEFDLLPGVLGDSPIHTLTAQQTANILLRCAPLPTPTSSPPTLSGALEDFSSYRVPLLSPGGGCSISGKLHPEPFPILRVCGGGQVAMEHLAHLRLLCNKLYLLPGVDWVGVYKVVPPVASLEEDLRELAMAQGGSPTANNLLKLAYLGSPSRPYFPLTSEFAKGSNNSTVGMEGVTIVIHDTRRLPSDAPYYTCDGKVRAEVCTPIWGSDGKVIGIIDAESFSPDAFRDRGVLAAILKTAATAAAPLKPI